MPTYRIGEDASMNLAAVELQDSPELRYLLRAVVTTSATFSPELADLMIYVIDVAEGEKFHERRPWDHSLDLVIINKIDLAPYVGACWGMGMTPKMRHGSLYVE